MKLCDFSFGQKVFVKNTLPKPPEHHSKKLKEWERGSFHGEILELCSERNEVLVKNDDASNTVVIFTHWISLDCKEKDIIPIEQPDSCEYIR